MYPKIQTLLIQKSKKFKIHFEVPLDNTVWQYKDIRSYKKFSNNQTYFTPNRPKAPFTASKSIIPITDFAHSLKHSFGIYMIAAQIPEKAFYVGIAAEGSKSPEGILKRISKHRIKMTASHVGRSENDEPITAGVSHTECWRDYANRRYIHLNKSGMLPDDCKDLQIAVASINNSGNDKYSLEQFEVQIHQNKDNIKHEIYNMFWPEEGNRAVFSLTSKTSRVDPDFNGIIKFEK